jgi:hypothetical protein
MDRYALLFGIGLAAAAWLIMEIREGHKKNSQGQAHLSEQSERMASELEDIHECLTQILAILRKQIQNR